MKKRWWTTRQSSKTRAKRWLGKTTGIPLTKAGRQRKIGRAVERGAGCSSVFVACCVSIWAFLTMACCCMSGDDATTAKKANKEPEEMRLKAGTNNPERDEVEVLNLDTLSRAYLADRPAAEKKYKGRTVELTATVYSPDSKNFDGPGAVLTTNVKGLVLSVWFVDILKTEVAALKKGQSIRIRGKVDGGTVIKEKGEVFFQVVDCVILEKQSEPTPPDTKSETKPKPGPTDTELLRSRQAAYIRIVAALDKVEVAAIKKFGRKPKEGDNAGVTVPWNLFVERETTKALAAIAIELNVTQSDVEAFHKEGVAKSWPTK